MHIIEGNIGDPIIGADEHNTDQLVSEWHKTGGIDPLVQLVEAIGDGQHLHILSESVVDFEEQSGAGPIHMEQGPASEPVVGLGDLQELSVHASNLHLDPEDIGAHRHVGGRGGVVSLPLVLGNEDAVIVDALGK